MKIKLSKLKQIIKECLIEEDLILESNSYFSEKELNSILEELKDKAIKKYGAISPVSGMNELSLVLDYEISDTNEPLITMYFNSSDNSTHAETWNIEVIG
jgi:hypothetical protein